MIDESDVADLEIGSDLLCKKEVPARRISPLSESSLLLLGLVENKAVPPDFNNIFASDTGVWLTMFLCEIRQPLMERRRQSLK